MVNKSKSVMIIINNVNVQPGQQKKDISLIALSCSCWRACQLLMSYRPPCAGGAAACHQQPQQATAADCGHKRGGDSGRGGPAHMAGAAGRVCQLPREQ